MKITSRLLLVFILIFSSKLFAQKSNLSEKPKLIIGIVIEGMRYDYLNRYWGKFGKKGFKRLLENGVICKNAKYDYLNTSSSSGYASIATGTQPSQHGIVGDYWHKRLSNQKFYCVSDNKTKILGNEKTNEKGKSPRAMFVSTFADELRISNFKQSKVISISPKDYAAILPGGYSANGTFWFCEKTGKWISSSYYFQDIPDWVKRFNRKKLAEIYLEKKWNTFLTIKKYSESLADSNSYEKGFKNNKNTFPYILKEINDKEKPYKIIHQTPFGNTFVKDFVVSAIVNEDLGQDEYTDFLHIGFTANENIAKLFGIRSVEIEDAYIRLDAELERFINFIDDYVGIKNTLFYLTADRGDAESPELLKDINMQGDYFNPNNSLSLLMSYFRAVYKTGHLVQTFNGNQIYLNRNSIEDLKIPLDEIQKKTADFMINFSGVTHAVTSLELETGYFTKGILLKAKNSYNKKRSGDIILNLASGIKFKNDEDTGNGYLDYTHVPLIWSGWRIKKGEITKQVSLTDIAPTLSNFLNISQPDATTGKPIEIPINK